MKSLLSRGKVYFLIFGFIFLTLPLKFALGANYGDVVINEIMWKGTPEWIELYNPTSQDIKMENWKIDNAKSGGKPLEGINGVIPANGYFLICGTGFQEKCDLNAPISLNDTYSTNGQLILRENEIIIDQTPVPKDEKWPSFNTSDEKCKLSFSTQRKFENQKALDGLNENSWECNVPSPQSSGIELKANAGDDVISTTGAEITFDASSSTGNIQEYFWNFGDGITMTDKIVTHKYQRPGEYYVYLKISDGKNESTDLKKVTIFSSEIFISEFLPNPKGTDSGGEWIEIVNESKEVQNITGWGIGNKAEKATFVFPEGTYLAPNGLLLLFSSLTKVSLLNENGSVFLFYPSGSIYQEVKYEKVDEGVAIARENGNYFYTQNPTPGMKNIISNYFSENKLTTTSQTQVQSQNLSLNSNTNLTSTSTPTVTSSAAVPAANSVISSPISVSTPTQNSTSSNTSDFPTKEDNNNPTLTTEENPLPTTFLTSNLLDQAKVGQNKLILAMLGVMFCSGFLAIFLVKWRKQLKYKANNNQLNLSNTNLEKIEVEIEK